MEVLILDGCFRITLLLLYIYYAVNFELDSSLTRKL